VGLTLALADTYFHPDGTWDGPSIPARDLPADHPLANLAWLMAGAYFEAAKQDDFIGVQTYSENRVGPDGVNLEIPEGVRMTTFSWSYTPEALGQTVRDAAAATGVPVIVTENGCPTDDDAERVEYLSRALTALRAAMDDGVDVRGYIHWSLLDNFEWTAGYGPKFGLVAVDRETFVRTPKASARYYAGLVAASRR
jgi:beta-glucosidase